MGEHQSFFLSSLFIFYFNEGWALNETKKFVLCYQWLVPVLIGCSFRFGRVYYNFFFLCQKQNEINGIETIFIYRPDKSILKLKSKTLNVFVYINFLLKF